MAAAAVVWGWLFEPNYGLVNQIIGLFGIDKIDWLSDPDHALSALMVIGTWKRIGYNMVIFLAGLQGIPSVYYEAADIDGASPWLKLRRITLPLLSPTTLFVVVMQFIASFRVFVSVSVMTRGGPAKSTQVITYYLYENAFKYLKFGYASAIAVVMFLLMAGFTVLQFRASKRRVHYS
jgi:ABC-type sugar transport system permease subunit